MSELTPYRAPAEVAIPSAAHALIEWAQSADAAYSLAQKIVSTSFCPQQFRNKPEDAAAAMLAGAEVGLSPLTALRAFDVISGQAAPRAITLRAIAQAQGHEVITDVANEQRCVMRGRRRGSTEWQTVEWTIARATKLGLSSKEQWRKQPQTMLVARATTELVRLIAADAILGVGYSAEEVADSTTVAVSRPPAPPVDDDAPKPRTVSRARKSEPPPEPEEPPLEPEQDAEPIFPDQPDLITPQQSKALHAALRKAGAGDREVGLEVIAGIIKRTVESSKELSRAEASSVLDALNDQPEDGWPQVAEPGEDR